MRSLEGAILLDQSQQPTARRSIGIPEIRYFGRADGQSLIDAGDVPAYSSLFAEVRFVDQVPPPPTSFGTILVGTHAIEQLTSASSYTSSHLYYLLPSSSPNGKREYGSVGWGAQYLSMPFTNIHMYDVVLVAITIPSFASNETMPSLFDVIPWLSDLFTTWRGTASIHLRGGRAGADVWQSELGASTLYPNGLGENTPYSYESEQFVGIPGNRLFLHGTSLKLRTGTINNQVVFSPTNWIPPGTSILRATGRRFDLPFPETFDMVTYERKGKADVFYSATAQFVRGGNTTVQLGFERDAPRFQMSYNAMQEPME